MATEQRCVRCCEVIQSRGQLRNIAASISDEPAWPGAELTTGYAEITPGPIHECSPVDLTRKLPTPMADHLL